MIIIVIPLLATLQLFDMPLHATTTKQSHHKKINGDNTIYIIINWKITGPIAYQIDIIFFYFSSAVLLLMDIWIYWYPFLHFIVE